MIKIIHTADLHLRASRAEECMASLKAIEQSAMENHPDLIVIAGDTWDGPIANTAGSLFNSFVERIRALADIAPVVTVYGTPSHDTAGSLDIFTQVESKYGITILEPGVPYFLDQKAVVSNKTSTAYLQIFGVPEPSKKWIAAEMKEAASEAARSALKSLFLGLAATKEKDLPTLLIYHGQVVGSKSATGFTVETSAFAATYDDLAAVGADYIALGDIHEPQKIGDLPAYYPGSAYPINWGESHQAGINLVSITEPDTDTGGLFSKREVSIERIHLPQPRRIKYEMVAGGKVPWDLPESDGVEGKLVWVEYTCRQDETIDTDFFYHTLLNEGALPGSRVTLNLLPIETVRAGEIAEAQRLRDKVQIYMTASGEEAEEKLLVKADELEERMMAAGNTPHGAHIRLDRLSLRGAIGIHRGTGLDTIEVDFKEYPRGLIGLIGSNGKGKTTLIENMHPWPSLLTRDGKLQDHFRLRDSWRELDFTDEATGIRYRSLLRIDGQNKTGSVEYYLYQKDANAWTPLADINGRKDAYVQAIEELFGSLSLYLRSAFISQRATKGNPDLADATKGERKSLFRELSGLDYLQQYSDTAKESEKQIRTEVNRDLGRMDAFKEQVSRKPAVELAIHNAARAKAEAEGKLAGVSDQYEKLSQQESELQKQVEQQEEIEKKRHEILEKKSQISNQIDLQNNEIKTYRSVVDRKDAAKKALDEYEALSTKKREIESQKVIHEEETAKAKDKWHQRKADRQRLETEISNRRADLSARSREIDLQLSHIREKLEEPISDACPTCGQRWPEEKRRAWLEERARIQKKGIALENEKIQLSEQINQAIKEIVDLPQVDDFEPDPFPMEAELKRILGDLEWFEPEKDQDTLTKAEVASARIEAAKERIAFLEDEASSLISALRELENKTDVNGLKETLNDATAARQAAQEEHKELTESVKQASSDLDYHRRLLADLASIENEMEALGNIIQGKNQDAEIWEKLAKACGPDGIQALELDNLAPSIAQVANELLAAAYDSRFRIEFRTTRIGGSGKKTKQIEDFLIYIHDTQAGSEQELSTLSGGEGVWIKKAIYDAFGIVRARNTGVQFLTCFQDEADGALDPEAKERFFRMMDAAHIQAGRRHTIIITHSREIQEMINEKIVMDELEEASSKGAA